VELDSRSEPARKNARLAKAAQSQDDVQVCRKPRGNHRMPGTHAIQFFFGGEGGIVIARFSVPSIITDIEFSFGPISNL